MTGYCRRKSVLTYAVTHAMEVHLIVTVDQQLVSSGPASQELQICVVLLDAVNMVVALLYILEANSQLRRRLAFAMKAGQEICVSTILVMFLRKNAQDMELVLLQATLTPSVYVMNLSLVKTVKRVVMVFVVEIIPTVALDIKKVLCSMAVELEVVGAIIPKRAKRIHTKAFAHIRRLCKRKNVSVEVTMNVN